MVLTQQLTRSVARSVITDIVLLCVVYYLPTISHALSFPLYMLDPMRIVIFFSILLTGNKTNSYIFAFTIPLFSYSVGGHPVFVKSLLIALELITNVAIFWTLCKRGTNILLTVFSSIFVAKLLYYSGKALLINLGCLNMGLIDTPFMIQLLVTLIISVVTSIAFKWSRNSLRL